jgi:hypothetical protein
MPFWRNYKNKTAASSRLWPELNKKPHPNNFSPKLLSNFGELVLECSFSFGNRDAD